MLFYMEENIQTKSRILQTISTDLEWNGGGGDIGMIPPKLKAPALNQTDLTRILAPPLPQHGTLENQPSKAQGFPFYKHSWRKNRLTGGL